MGSTTTMNMAMQAKMNLRNMNMEVNMCMAMNMAMQINIAMVTMNIPVNMFMPMAPMDRPMPMQTNIINMYMEAKMDMTHGWVGGCIDGDVDIAHRLRR